jgi:hypothetical protein
MKDFLGNELKIGDEVVFDDGQCFVRAVIREFAGSFVVVVAFDGFEGRKFPDELIKVIKEQ